MCGLELIQPGPNGPQFGVSISYVISYIEHTCTCVQGCIQYRSGYIGIRRCTTIERVASLAAT